MERGKHGADPRRDVDRVFGTREVQQQNLIAR
jgi:hypothetical protein